jgi:hypothetical protein
MILLPFRRKACWGFLSPFKNPTASAGFEPANLGIRGHDAAYFEFDKTPSCRACWSAYCHPAQEVKPFIMSLRSHTN